MPFQAASLASKIGLEAFVALELGWRRTCIAPHETITTLLSRAEIPSTTPPCNLVEIFLSMHGHPSHMRAFLSCT